MASTNEQDRFPTAFIVPPKLYFVFVEVESISVLSDVVRFIDSWTTSMIFITLVLAIGFLFTRKILHYILIGLMAIVGAILFNEADEMKLSVN